MDNCECNFVVLVFLQTRKALTPEKINQACNVDISSNKVVFESLKNNPKVNYDGKCFSYKVTEIFMLYTEVFLF